MAGVTLIELLLIITIVSVLTMVALPAYKSAREKLNIGDATADLMHISQQITRYYADWKTWPSDLDAIGSNLTDPWGNDYQYLNMALVQGHGLKRKDRNMVPLNTDYDLYSKGPDGESVNALTAQQSKDDIIRAGNGQYLGIAEDYSF
ncbi:MAG: general secretion pathway protein G [Halioglobus sp.]|jgi:general secretion pathway protein G